MKLSISNIGWDAEQDEIIFTWMKEIGYEGLEIAPTRIFPENPYHDLKSAKAWSESLFSMYGFVIPSMQSIWYGRQEKLFGTEKERDELVLYTKKAINFASSIGCKNLVFGCPRNRLTYAESDWQRGIDFFRELGDYAYNNGTIIGMEANPPIYHTNYINDTKSAIGLVKEVNSKGFLLYLDVGTMIENEESLEELRDNIHLINHVHISEPNLKLIVKRCLHMELADILKNSGYQGYVSIEMGKQNNIDLIREVMCYVRDVF